MFLTVKPVLFSIIGVTGGFVLSCYGGWTQAMTALVIFMVVDVLTGITVAIKNKSQKTETGGLSSKSMTIGLLRKGVIMLVVLVAAQIDILINGGNLIRNSAVIAFCVNEILSIFENVGLAGVKLPKILVKSIDMLNQKYNINEGDE